VIDLAIDEWQLPLKRLGKTVREVETQVVVLEYRNRVTLTAILQRGELADANVRAISLMFLVRYEMIRSCEFEDFSEAFAAARGLRAKDWTIKLSDRPRYRKRMKLPPCLVRQVGDALSDSPERHVAVSLLPTTKEHRVR